MVSVSETLDVTMSGSGSLTSTGDPTVQNNIADRAASPSGSHDLRVEHGPSFRADAS